MGKLILVFSSLIIGISIGIRLSFTALQSNQLTGVFNALCSIWPQFVSQIRQCNNDYTSVKTCKGIDSDSDFDPHARLPSCLRYPFRVDELTNMGYLSLLGYVFEVSTDDPMFGVNGSHAQFTGHEGTYHFLGEKEPSRYALDGVATPVLADLLRWLHLLNSRYKCVGYLPGIYFDPMGDPTDYMQSIMKAWSQIVRDQLNLLSVYPKCERVASRSGVVYMNCPEVVGSDGERVRRSPRLLAESSRRSARCACVQHDSVYLHSQVRLMNYPRCDPAATRCQVSRN